MDLEVKKVKRKSEVKKNLNLVVVFLVVVFAPNLSSTKSRIKKITKETANADTCNLLSVKLNSNIWLGFMLLRAFFGFFVRYTQKIKSAVGIKRIRLCAQLIDNLPTLLDLLNVFIFNYEPPKSYIGLSILK